MAERYAAGRTNKPVARKFEDIKDFTVKSEKIGKMKKYRNKSNLYNSSYDIIFWYNLFLGRKLWLQTKN